MRYLHKCCFTWYYYIDSCNTRYAPNRRIWHLKFQNFSGGNTPDPQGGRGRPHPAPTPSTAFGYARGRKRPRVGIHASKTVPPKSKIATTPLDCMRVSFRRQRHQNIAARMREGWRRQCRVTQAKLERKPNEIRLWINNRLI